MIDTVSRESVMELIRPSEISGNEGDIYEHPNALYKYARVAGFAMKNTIEDLKTRNVLQEKEFLIQRLERALETLWNAIEKYKPKREDMVLKKIAFTCERTGKRWEFNSMTKLIEAFLNAAMREVATGKYQYAYDPKSTDWRPE